MEKLTIMCICVNGTGHINAMTGIAAALQSRGHTIVFAAERSRKGTFTKLGFHEELYDEPTFAESGGNNLIPVFAKLESSSVQSTLDCYPAMMAALDRVLENTMNSNDRVKEIIEKWKPNAIIEDRVLPMPALVSSGAPLIKLCSFNPLYAFDDERLPPAFLGLSLTDKSNWKEMRQKVIEMKGDTIRRINKWLQEKDKSVPKIDIHREYISTNLNIYLYPRALVDDYLKLYPDALRDEWVRLDYSIRQSSGEFEIPGKLKTLPGKLIYVSMGTLGTAMLSLMRKLISAFAKSEHRFIFSMGESADKLELAGNMWGESYLPQLDILPHVDLVVFHGGNNTLLESIYCAKPMIVLPLFCDQFDNAQRVVEMELGLSFNPFAVQEQELINAVEHMLKDTEMVKRLQKVSYEMRESDSMENVCGKIETVVKHPKFPTITGIIDI